VDALPVRVTTRTPNRGRDDYRAAGPARWALRTLITVHLLGVCGQAVLAGRFLAGDYPMLQLHADNARATAIVGFAQLLCAVLYWRPAGGPGWPALASLGLAVAEPTQIYLGFQRLTGVHVPLGVAIVVGSAAFAGWAWRPGFGRGRPPSARAVA
jgi:hypothetical protein